MYFRDHTQVSHAPALVRERVAAAAVASNLKSDAECRLLDKVVRRGLTWLGSGMAAAPCCCEKGKGSNDHEESTLNNPCFEGATHLALTREDSERVF